MKNLLVLAALFFCLPAHAEDMNFYLHNQRPEGVAVELFSHDRKTAWPGGDKVYLLDGGEKKSVKISCNAGENICLGAWIAGNDGIAWGVGPDDDVACEDCCRICVDKSTELFSVGP